MGIFNLSSYKMSVELLAQCKRKLSNSLSKLDKTIQSFDSEPLEKCLIETCKADNILSDTKDSIREARQELQRNTNKIRELNQKVRASLANEG